MKEGICLLPPLIKDLIHVLLAKGGRKDKNLKDAGSKIQFLNQRLRKKRYKMVHLAVAPSGFRSTKMTESPRKNILLINLSLFTGFAFFFPLPVFGTSVHISFTYADAISKCCILK